MCNLQCTMCNLLWPMPVCVYMCTACFAIRRVLYELGVSVHPSRGDCADSSHCKEREAAVDRRGSMRDTLCWAGLGCSAATNLAKQQQTWEAPSAEFVNAATNMKSFSSKGKHIVAKEASVGQQLRWQTLLGWVGPKSEHEKQVNRKQRVTQGRESAVLANPAPITPLEGAGCLVAL